MRDSAGGAAEARAVGIGNPVPVSVDDELAETRSTRYHKRPSQSNPETFRPSLFRDRRPHNTVSSANGRHGQETHIAVIYFFIYSVKDKFKQSRLEMI